MSETVLKVDNLNMHYETSEGNVTAVKDVSFSINKGESFGLVGESGCGKTSVAMSLLQLQADNAKISSGSIILDGQDLVGLTENELRKVRWNGISIVFQGAMNAWNPVVKVGEQIREAIREHYPNNSKLENTQKIASLFEMVGLDRSTMDRFPHELSGGMQQRASIVRALSFDPSVLLMDEPFSAVDEQTRRKFQEDLLSLVQNENKTFLFVTHSIEEAVYVSDQIAILLPRPSRVSEIIRPTGFRNKDKDSIRRDAEYLDIVDKIWASLRTYVE